MAGIKSKDAEQIMKDYYGRDCNATFLESEWAGTFKISTTGGSTFLLKLTPDHVDSSRTELEIAVIEHLMLSNIDIAFPRLINTSLDKLSVKTDFGIARVYEWVEGRLWHEVNPHSPQLLQSLGSQLAQIKQQLDKFDHPAAHFAFEWSPENVAWVEGYTDVFNDKDRSSILNAIKSGAEIADTLKLLPHAINHNDANDHNIIVSHDKYSPEVLGFIDFGDLHYGPRINDLAICLAYTTMRKPDPICAATDVIRGFHEVSPLSENELLHLPALIKSRLAITITKAAIRAKKDPDNAYWQVSASDASQLLEKLCAYPQHLAICRFREACGMEPSPNNKRLTSWLIKNKANFYPITGIELKETKVEVFDWSVGSLDMGSLNDIADVEESTRKVFKQMKEADVSVGIGRYNEPRAVYTTPEYAIPCNNGPEMRTIHIGIDIFLNVGSTLYAPLDGKVYAIVDDAGDKEYGPLVILEHKPEPDLTFYTLYGHNSLTTLDLLRQGEEVKRGQPIAFVGDYPENGNWVPHSHFQIIADMLDYPDDYPGVALASQRDVWLSLCPDPNLMLGISDPRMRVPNTTSEEMIGRRKEVLGPNLSLAGIEPLHIVRGWKSHLYTADGTSYLDTRNNISHVAHEHPRIVAAGQRQMAVLNTNTRYLHKTRLELADRLLETLPDHLAHIYFVNTGSEANDLALRMARNHIGTNATLVMDQAYHGVTAACLEVSPHKFEGKGGSGCPSHVRVLPGLQTVDETTTDLAISDITTIDPVVGPVTFIHETLPGCAGQIIPPSDYFSSLYNTVRQDGGICIADEVQSGMGRVGKKFWSFQLYDIVPDIVTIGKPLGNGHPIAAVAVSEAVAQSFDNGMEFFSSFGGNPVSCAIALEVMDVIRDEGLQLHAIEMGKYWMDAIRHLAEDYPLIQEVRGHGLFFGIAFFQENNQGNAASTCRYIQSRLLDHRILSSFDGPKHNVMLIKPPMCITHAEVDHFIQILKKVLEEDPVSI